jgi:tetratricopeptide (TPR) repeat protein
MKDDSDSLAAFRRLLETTTAPAGADSPELLTDSLVGSEAGALLRRCAVPHEFDRALLQHLGGLDAAEAAERYAQFSELSVMQINDGALCVHERWRRSLWRWWLDDSRRAEFVALNETLVEWFAARAEQGDATAARRRMFHLLGCRQDEGLRTFETMFRSARHLRHFSECSLLLRLVHEYDPLLRPGERAVLTYHEGKLASDLRDWDRSLALLHEVSDDDAAALGLRLSAQVRTGHALSQAGRPQEALVVLERAHVRIAAEPTVVGLVWRVLYELGEVYRDLGRADDASATLARALASAGSAEQDVDVAGILNSLGTVQLKLREIDAAIESFRASLADLAQRGDAVRSGGVLNNLGLAQLERCDWQDAEASLSASLESKRAAGDAPGQATALLNLSRVQAAQERFDDACRSAEQAAALFEASGDLRASLRARLAKARLVRRAGRWGESVPLLRAVASEADAAGDEATASAARAELERKEPKRGLRWWAWMLIALPVLLLLTIAVLVAVEA